MSIRRLFAVLTLLLAAHGAQANETLEDRLGAVLGQEKQALAMVPSARLDVLTAPPRDEVATAPADFAYTDAYLRGLPAASGGAEWQCLSEALYFEARGESVRGLFAVGEVILNRRDSAAFPGSVCGVVHQGTGRRYACQFTYTCDGHSDHIGNPAAFSRVGKVARLLLDGAGRDLTAGATHYHTHAVSPSWARRFAKTATIGAHRFYRQPVRTASN